MIRTEKGSGALSDGSVLSTPVCPRRVSPRLSPGRIDMCYYDAVTSCLRTLALIFLLLERQLTLLKEHSAVLLCFDSKSSVRLHTDSSVQTADGFTSFP